MDSDNLTVVECPECGSRTSVHHAGCEQQCRELRMVRDFLQEISEAFQHRGWLLTEA